MGFHLGTLSYLDRVGLLEKVRILSTVSGGTAIGIGYAAYRQIPKDNERPLMTLYREMHEQIPPDPAALLKMLQDAAVKYSAAPSGRRTLISNLACGQATICYNLLKHMQFMLEKNPDLINNNQFKKLYDDIEKDWEHLKANSYALPVFSKQFFDFVCTGDIEQLDAGRCVQLG